MKKVIIHVTPQIINIANIANTKDCLVYHAILPVLKDEYKEYLQVGVQTGGFYKEITGGDGWDTLFTIIFSKDVVDYIENAFRAKYNPEIIMKPKSFEIEIPEEFLKD